MFTKTENFIGMTVAVIVFLVILSFIVSMFIFISFGIIYLLSYSPFIEFHYFSSFWHNVWYFFGFLLLNALVLGLSEIVVFIDRKNKKINSLEDISPSNFIEWIKFIIIFVIYMNVFTLISDRLDATILGSTLVAFSFVFFFFVVGKIIDSIADDEKDKIVSS
ncbi:hypothetical protein CAI16_11770 [Virgibacillus dokdonensis]|uniref:Uncharacterized protein n=1 Tax=Virgibacillus dokdonensis TaxID=302167 RepID=A0A3E0WMQ6_9BACI|nr:hypothetical protein [Virgibacillus dokdonensis]RFA34260.1 hypothetical protein CAI16_11770 [Virgibacillus dokdonensis]